ncbi:MAG: translocation/assembly module TamB domain-containing protein, partial [bacterium]
VFRENQVEINPEVYFLAVADINEYKISMRLFGALNDFKMELYSEPALSQNDILSLLTLGFTSEVSQGLGDSDRQALTSAGIGSLLLEQFKIGKALKNTLGVKLNVSSEIERSDQNVLEHRRTGDSGDAVSLRSATKIELSKQISKKVNMSVSGTVGGSIGQKQQMNLDYQLDDNIIASGLYESRSNTDSEEETSDTALGVELRFKWTLD